MGKRRARIDPEPMRQLGIEPGQVIELIGKRNTAAIGWQADDEQGRDIIRIDGQTRKNAGIGINDLLSIKPIKAKPAKMVVLLPLANNSVVIDKEFCEFVKNRLAVTQLQPAMRYRLSFWEIPWTSKSKRWFQRL